MSRRYAVVFLAVVAVALTPSAPLFAHPVLLAGNDCFVTGGGVSTATLPAIPANFFAAGSDAIPAGLVINLTGSPLPAATIATQCVSQATKALPIVTSVWGPHVTPNETHFFATAVAGSPNIDTIVSRNQAMDFAANGVPQVTPVEMVALSLVSIAPVVVTFGGGSPQNWNVAVVLDGAQTPGSVTFTPSAKGTSVTGTALTTSLPVKYKVSFTNGPNTRELTNQNLNFTNTAGTFDFPFLFPASAGVPTLSEWGLIFLAGLLLVTSIFLLRRQRNLPTATS